MNEWILRKLSHEIETQSLAMVNRLHSGCCWMHLKRCSGCRWHANASNQWWHWHRYQYPSIVYYEKNVKLCECDALLLKPEPIFNNYEQFRWHELKSNRKRALVKFLITPHSFKDSKIVLHLCVSLSACLSTRNVCLYRFRELAEIMNLFLLALLNRNMPQ